ncbi:hypothetical protein Bca101_016445 [Brassica carinata]
MIDVATRRRLERRDKSMHCNRVLDSSGFGRIKKIYLTMELTWLSALIVGAALGFCIRSKPSPPPPVDEDVSNKLVSKEPLEIEKLADILDDFKMVLVVRNDLKMGKGKIAAQCSHATLGLYKKLVRRAPKALTCWEECSQPKVVVKIETEDEMLELQLLVMLVQLNLLGFAGERAKSLMLPTHITIDAGRTQIAPSEFSCPSNPLDSRTVMAILGPVQVVDEVTGGLKLL